MPGPALPIAARVLTAARTARSLYNTAKPFIRKEIKDFKKHSPGMLPTAGTGLVITQANELTGRKMGDKISKLSKKALRKTQSQLSNFSRKLIK